MPIENAIILAGGFGTRLRPLTARTTKALLPVGNRPFLETLFARLAQAGVRRAVLSTHHQAASLSAALPALRRFGLKVALRREPKPLGTGGAIRYSWPDPEQPCLVLNGDVLGDFDLRSLVRAHQKSGALATLGAISVDDTRAYGVLESDVTGRLTRFVEKPRPGESDSRLVNAGIYALGPGVLRFIGRGRPTSVEREVFPLLLAAGQRLQACAADAGGYWNDIGTPAAFLRANQDVLQRRLWQGRGLAEKLWGRPDARGNLRAPSVRVAKGAVVSRSVLGPGCTVGAGALVHGSVLLAGCAVGEQSSLDGALLAEGAIVGSRCAIKAGAVLGPGTRVSDDSQL